MNIAYKFSYFLILLLPLSLISGPALPDISITLIGILFLSIFFFKKQIKSIHNNFVIISILFWLFLIFISLFAQNKLLAYRDAIIFIRILLIPIFMYYWIFDSNKKISLLSSIILASVLFVCIDSFFQFLKYDPAYGFGKDIFGYIPEFYGRLSGPFRDLIPGSYISKFSLFGLIPIFSFINNHKLKIILSIIYISISGSIIFMSGERMALATYLLGLFLLMLIYKNKRIIFMISLLFIFLSILALNKFHPIYNDYKIIESTPYHLGLKVEKEVECINKTDIKCKKIILLQPDFMKVIYNFSDSAYGQIYLLSYQMIKDNFWSGIGLNNFTYLCNNDEKYKNKIKNYNCVTHPHNFYIQWFVETGLFGLIIFIIYISSLLLFIYKKIANEYTPISLATFVILFWPFMSTGSLLKNWMGVSTFFIIGICLIITNIKQKN